MTAAELPPAVESKPPEQPEAESPAEKAAQNELKKRLAEMERAEGLHREAQQQQQRPQQQQQQPEMPAHVAKWLAEHPQYMDPNDQIAQVEISLATMKATRDGLTWNDDDFLPAIERHLGLRQRPQPNGNGRTESAPAPAPTRPVTVDRPPPQRMSVPVSAPPTHQPPRMSTGRARTYRQPLNKEEVEVASQSLGVSLDEYQRNKERWQKMKSEGAQ